MFSPVFFRWPPESLFCYFLVSLNFLGFRALQDLLPLTRFGSLGEPQALRAFEPPSWEKVWAGLLPDLRAYHWWPGFSADSLGALFGLKHMKISRKPPKRALFSFCAKVGLHETLVIGPAERWTKVCPTSLRNSWLCPGSLAQKSNSKILTVELAIGLRNLESPFAVRSDSNRHRFGAIF